MVMQEVRTLLTEGRSSREVIDLGYAPGTVYKVQRRMRRPEKRDTAQYSSMGLALAVDPMAEGNSSEQDSDDRLIPLLADLDALRLEVRRVDDQLAEHQSLHEKHGELPLMVDRIGQEVSHRANIRSCGN